MRVLHVAALPFPSVQGTQAALHQILQAQAHSGQDVHLLCYAHGEGSPQGRYQVHRIPDWPQERTLRSGPSLRKPLLDLSLALRLRSLHARLSPDMLVAHHVEAACAAHLAGLFDHTYVAHTSLEHELPGYFPAILRGASAAVGALAEGLLVRGSRQAVAVSPLLARLLSSATGRRVEALAIPWPLSPTASGPGRVRACEQLGIDSGVDWFLYAGNLDHYQGWDTMLEAFALLSDAREGLGMLVATRADPRALWRRADALGIRGRLRCVPLSGEPQRQRLHAASCCVVVPRRSPGGLPVKLLDALARGVPVVAARRAAAGLPLEECCVLADDDDPRALWRAMSCVLDDPAAAEQRVERALAYLGSAHDPAGCMQGLSSATRAHHQEKT